MDPLDEHSTVAVGAEVAAAYTGTWTGGGYSKRDPMNTSKPKGSTLEEALLINIIRVSAKAHGIVVGLCFGLAIFIMTNWLVLKGGATVGPHLALLGQFFIGYSVTFPGSLIGFVYGFGCGFALGYFAASIYNRIVDLKGRRG